MNAYGLLYYATPALAPGATITSTRALASAPDKTGAVNTIQDQTISCSVDPALAVDTVGRAVNGNAPYYIGAGTVAWGNTTGVGVTPGLPTGYAANDIFLLVVHASVQADITTPAGWNELLPGAVTLASPVEMRFELFWRRATASESAPTVAAVSGTAIRGARILGIRGAVATGDPFAGMSRNNCGVSDTLTTIAMTPITNNTFNLFVFSFEDDPAVASQTTFWGKPDLVGSALTNGAAIGVATMTQGTAASLSPATQFSGGTFTNSVGVATIISLLQVRPVYPATVRGILTPTDSRSDTADPLTESPVGTPVTVDGRYPYDSAWSLNGSSDVRFTNADVEIGVSNVKGAFALWYKPTAGGSSPDLLSFGNGATPAGRAFIIARWTGPSTVTVEFYNPAGGLLGSFSTSTDATYGQWGFLYVDWEGGNVRLRTDDNSYVTGMRIPATEGNFGGLYIVGDSLGGTAAGAATIGPVALFTAPLADVDVECLYDRAQVWALDMDTVGYCDPAGLIVCDNSRPASAPDTIGSVGTLSLITTVVDPAIAIDRTGSITANVSITCSASEGAVALGRPATLSWNTTVQTAIDPATAPDTVGAVVASSSVIGTVDPALAPDTTGSVLGSSLITGVADVAVAIGAIVTVGGGFSATITSNRALATAVDTSASQVRFGLGITTVRDIATALDTIGALNIAQTITTVRDVALATDRVGSVFFGNTITTVKDAAIAVDTVGIFTAADLITITCSVDPALATDRIGSVLYGNTLTTVVDPALATDRTGEMLFGTRIVGFVDPAFTSDTSGLILLPDTGITTIFGLAIAEDVPAQVWTGSAITSLSQAAMAEDTLGSVEVFIGEVFFGYDARRQTPLLPGQRKVPVFGAARPNRAYDAERTKI